MNAREFAVTSSRGDVNLHCVEWSIEKPKATLQILHGMVEHITRYSDFASFLNDNGIAVIGHDHLGHGDTSPDDLGFIAEKNGDEILVEDAFLITERISRMYEGIPHFILGHSMGSFVLRRYLTRYGDMVDGAVIMGTGNQSAAAAAVGKLISGMLTKTKGPRHRSPFMDRTVLGGYDRKFSSPDIKNRWISRDEEAIRNYNSDPYCSFTFTVSAYRDLMTLISKCVKGYGLDDVPKSLPLLLISGKDDPVGDFGNGVLSAKELMEKHGLRPELILYEGARHEILNETNRAGVYVDLMDWLTSHLRHP